MIPRTAAFALLALQGAGLRAEESRERVFDASLLDRTRWRVPDARYRSGWRFEAELDNRRLHPLPGEIRGYGTGEKRAELLDTMRALTCAKGKQAFLERVKSRIQRGYLSVLFVPRGGQGPTWYGFSAEAVAALSEEQFRTWRTRFLRWVEIHTPGQSQVARFATASDEEFEAMYVASKDRHGAHDIKRALERFKKRTGIGLAYPRFSGKKTAPVVAEVMEGSAAAESGLARGDRVLEVEGVAVPQWNDFVYHVGGYRPGSAPKLVVRPRDLEDTRTVYLRIVEER